MRSTDPHVHFMGLYNDPHILRVSSIIERSGIPVSRYSLISDNEQDPYPSFSSDTPISCPVNRTVDGVGSSVLWVRDKFRSLVIRNYDDQRRHFEARTREDFITAYALNQGWSIINRKKNTYSDKMRQLMIAKTLGAAIPRTLISQNRDEIISFVTDVGDAIVKPFSTSMAPPIGNDIMTLVSIGTNKVELAELMAASNEAVASSPAIYQECVSKSYELRVVAFRKKSVGYKINSQDFEKSKLDWRLGESLPGMVDSRPVDLDPSMCLFMERILNKLSLDTAVFDFAIRPDGSWVFFECNPTGQWAGLEREDGPISEMISVALIDSLKRAA